MKSFVLKWRSFVLIPMLCLLCLLFFIPVNASQVKRQEPIELNDGWMYRLGDDTSAGWNNTNNFYGLDSAAKNVEAVWFKIRIPTGDWENYSIYFEKIYGQSLEVYFEQKKIYERTRVVWPFTNNTNREIFTLGQECGGETLYLRVVPGIMLDNVGPRPKVLIGNMSDLMPIYFKESFNRIIINIIIGSIFTLLGIVTVFISIFIKKEKRKSWTSVGLVILNFGILVSLSLNELYLLLGHFEVYALIVYDIIKILFLNSITYLLIQILGSRYNLTALKKMFLIQNAYSALCYILLFIHLCSGFGNFSIYRLFSYDILGILYIIELFILMTVVIYYALKKDADAKIILLGFLFFILFMAIDFIIFFALRRDYVPLLWYWGIFGLVFSFFAILGRRIAEDHKQVVAYSRELEAKNKELDTIWKEVKESRDQLAQLNKTLEMRVYERTEQLETANEELTALNEELRASNDELYATMNILKETQAQLIHSEKMAALGQLVAGVAHEINTPIGAIHSSIENILETLNEVNEELPRFIFSLSGESMNSYMLILNEALKNDNELLSSREERSIKKALIKQLEDHHILHPEELAAILAIMGISDIIRILPALKDSQIKEILKMVYAMSGIQRSARIISVATERTSKIVFALKSYAHFNNTGQMVTADVRDSIETALALYHNKMKESVELIRNYEEVRPILCYPDDLNQAWANIIHNALHAINFKGTVKIHVFQTDKHVVVSITDSGKGIPNEIKERIFEPFFTTKSLGEGSGLGLDIVKKIINKHNGEIKVASIPGETTFTVYIPFN